jgi:hypothetical protein
LDARYACTIIECVPKDDRGGWLLLIHQIPPKPNYFRVKIWRRLQRLGAVGIKNSVYALPASEQAQEDLNWVLREIVGGGGDASLVQARLIEGLNDEQVKEMFRAARDADYRALAADARGLAEGLPRRGDLPEEKRAELAAALERLRKRESEIAALDFFHARGRETLDGVLRGLDERLARRAAAVDAASAAPALPLETPRGAIWVTRTGIHVDRMASAWLIRRFIDPRAKLKFVATREYRHQPGELRFDMFEGEFTHQGELCTFEVLLDRFGLEDPALRPIAEIVHDIDLKDQRHGRPENAGLEHLIQGIALAHEEDEVRLQRSSAVLDDLYEYFRRKRRS